MRIPYPDPGALRSLKNGKNLILFSRFLLHIVRDLSRFELGTVKSSNFVIDGKVRQWPP
jgi:hypothetical protein